jgi:branched-chain amino acid transport system permease protein
MGYLLQSLVNALSLGALYAMLALGIAIVFSVMRLINFAHSALIMVAAYIVYLLAQSGMWVWVPAAILGAALLSVLIERVAFRPLRGADGASLLVASFAVATVIQAIAQILSGSIPKSPELPAVMTGSISIGSFSVSNLSIMIIIIAVITAALLAVFFSRTMMGTQMRAAAENFQMARLLGIRSNRVISVAFLISGALAGICGILLTAQTGSVTPMIGFQPTLIGFIAVVIGGMGSIVGSALGGVVLGAGWTMLQAYLPAGVVGYRDAIVYCLVIALLLIRPEGLFGRSERRA